jgi:hypothetical protein
VSPAGHRPLPRLGRRAALFGAVSLACGREPAATPAKPPPPPRYSGNLEDYVPAAGLRWLIRGNPAKLAKSQSFRPALELLLSKARLEAVAKTSGFALETLQRGLIAGFDLGTLYLAELPTPTAAKARDAFVARQINPSAPRTPEPGITVLSGTNEGSPLGLVTLDDRVVAYGSGDPMLWRVVEAYARHRLKAKRAFEGAALSGLSSETEDALIAAYVPGPFDDRWQRAFGGLLAIATALSAELVPTSADHARLDLTLHGDFADSDAEERLRSTYMSVAQSSTGMLLGLGTSLDAKTRINAQKDRVTLMVPLPVTEIAKAMHQVTSGGLKAIFSGDVGGAARDNTGAEDNTPTSSPESR